MTTGNTFLNGLESETVYADVVLFSEKEFAEDLSTMKKLAIFCNVVSSVDPARRELFESLRNKGYLPYWGCIYDGKTNAYFSDKTAICLPITASRNNTNPIVELRSMHSVKKAVKANQIDFAIVYGVKNHAAMAIGAKMGGAKHILCVVNGSGNLFRIGGLKGWILRFMSFPMLRLTYKCSNSVCFQNEDDKALFVKKHLIKDNDKCFVTNGSGVNLEIFKKQELPKSNRFLFLSRITPSKGISEYIKAVSIVKEKYPDAVFDVVGPMDSSVENSLGGLLQNAVDAGMIYYHGPTDDVPSWMASCRFFVYPSYYPEGVPRCAIQAIATGRPIITCNTPGCKETVSDGVNGFSVPPRNEVALAEKMIWMIENPELVEKMADASRRLAEDKFDVYKINRELIEKMNE